MRSRKPVPDGNARAAPVKAASRSRVPGSAETPAGMVQNSPGWSSATER